MNQQRIVLFASLIISIWTQAQVRNDKHTLLEMGISGKVRQLREYSFLATQVDTGVLKGTRIIGTDHEADKEMFFDERGNCTNIFYWDFNDTIIGQTYFRYTPAGFPECDSQTFAAANFSDYVVYEYDVAGRLIARRVYYLFHNGDRQVKHFQVWTYDDAGQISSTTYIDSLRPDFSYTQSFTYNSRGQVTSDDMYKYESKSRYRYLASCDDSSNVTLYYEIEAIGHPAHDIRWWYEDRRFPKKVTAQGYYSGGKEMDYNRFIYFDNGVLQQKETYEGEARQLYMIEIYDIHGNLTDRNFFNAEGFVSSKHYDYRYDEHGNWISKTIYINGIPKWISDRTIIYY